MKVRRRVVLSALVLAGIVWAGSAGNAAASDRTSTQPLGRVAVSATYDGEKYYEGTALPQFNPIYKEKFDSWFNRYILTRHTPHHNGYDQVWNAGDNQVIRGKFHYGDIRKDLEGEWVSVYANKVGTSSWTFIGRQKTNGDGRISIQVPENKKLPKGDFVIKLYVEGDGTFVNSHVKVVQGGEKFVVFDIDGTLTLSDGEVTREMFDDFFFERYKSKEYDGSQEAVWYYKNRGYSIIYLTARPYWLGDLSSKWLIDKGFPIGVIHTREEGIPLENADVYKGEYLQSVLDTGAIIERAYGNAMTDIYAYKNIGVPNNRIYIIGENAGKEGTVPIASYPQHLQSLE